MSGGFFIAPKSKGPSKEEGMKAMRIALGLEQAPVVEEEEVVDPKKRVRKKKVQIEEDPEAVRKANKPKPTVLGTIFRPVTRMLKKRNFKEEFKTYVKREILHKKNFKGPVFYSRAFLVFCGVVFYLGYGIVNGAANEWHIAKCKMSGFAEECDGGTCSLIVSVRTLADQNTEVYQRGWFPETKAEGADVVFVEQDLFKCCPLDNCCGFAVEGEKDPNSPVMNYIFCDSDEFVGSDGTESGCGPDPWDCYFKDYVSTYEVTGLKVGTPWFGTELLVLSLVCFGFFLTTFKDKWIALYEWGKKHTIAFGENIPWMFLRGLWWIRFVIITGIFVPLTKAIDVVSLVFSVPLLHQRHIQRMEWIDYMNRFAQLPEVPTESEEEIEPEIVTMKDVVEEVMAQVKKQKYPSMKKQLRPLIKPLPFDWQERTKVPDELVKRLRIADALERDRAMYKPDYLKEERHKYDAAFSNPLRITAKKPKEVEPTETQGPALRPDNYATPDLTPPASPKAKASAGKAKAAAGPRKASSGESSSGEEEEDHSSEAASTVKYERKPRPAKTVKVQEPGTENNAAKNISAMLGAASSTPGAPSSRGSSPDSVATANTKGTSSAAPKAKAAGLGGLGGLLKTATAAQAVSGFARPQQKTGLRKKDELEMTPEEYARHQEEREKRNKFKRMRGEPTSSDEEKAALTRELGNLQAAERDAKIFEGRGNVLGVVSMMRRTANKLAERKRKRDEARLVREQTGISRTQAEIMRLPFDRRDGPDLRVRTRTDMQISETTPTLEKLQEEAFPEIEDRECYQWRSVAFQNRLALDSTTFRYNPEWHREGKFQPPLQQVRGNMVVHKKEIGEQAHQMRLRETLWYFADKRKHHAETVTGDQEHWMKLLDGYKLWCRKAKFMKGFDRKFAPDLDFLFADGDTEEKAINTQSLGAVAGKIFQTDAEIPDRIRAQVEKDLGPFVLDALCADELGLLPHRVKDTPIASRLLVNQSRKRKDVALWGNTAVADRPPGVVRWLPEKARRKKRFGSHIGQDVSPERGVGGGAKDGEKKDEPMIKFDWKKMLGLG